MVLQAGGANEIRLLRPGRAQAGSQGQTARASAKLLKLLGPSCVHIGTRSCVVIPGLFFSRSLLETVHAFNPFPNLPGTLSGSSDRFLTVTLIVHFWPIVQDFKSLKDTFDIHIFVLTTTIWFCTLNPTHSIYAPKCFLWPYDSEPPEPDYPLP